MEVPEEKEEMAKAEGQHQGDVREPEFLSTSVCTQTHVQRFSSIITAVR